jgi:SAM-dependent methyltransferase
MRLAFSVTGIIMRARLTEKKMSNGQNLDPKSLFYTNDDFQKMVDALRSNLTDFLVVDQIRHIIAETRLRYFNSVGMYVTVEKNYDANSVAKLTIEHNLSGLGDISAPRSHFLLRPLMSISEVFHSRFSGETFLSIGPRSEGEILNLIGYGVPIHQIKGLDLISCSPFVQTGDMHDMPYEDNSVSVIILGFVLGYSKNPKKLVEELYRISKNGAIIAIGNEFNPKSNEELRVEAGYDSWEVMRYNDAQQIIDLFSDITEKVLFQTEPPAEYRHSAGPIGVIIKVKKP